MYVFSLLFILFLSQIHESYSSPHRTYKPYTIINSQIKKSYLKAIRYVHPDKLPGQYQLVLSQNKNDL